MRCFVQTSEFPQQHLPLCPSPATLFRLSLEPEKIIIFPIFTESNEKSDKTSQKTNPYTRSILFLWSFIRLRIAAYIWNVLFYEIVTLLEDAKNPQSKGKINTLKLLMPQHISKLSTDNKLGEGWARSSSDNSIDLNYSHYDGICLCVYLLGFLFGRICMVTFPCAIVSW